MSTPTHRRGALAALASVLVLVSCDDDPTRAAGAVEGTWALVADDAPAVYLRIDGESIETFTEDTIADCFERLDYEVLDIEGTSFRITTGSADTFSVNLRRDGDELIVDAFGQEDRYEPSALDPATLLQCGPPSSNADCATLPGLAVDQLDGELTESDAQNPDGSRYDLYALRPDAPLELEVGMSSSQMDSYLVLFDSAGVYLEANDDASNLTVNARLTPSVEPGCYILMATTAFPDELGEYVLTFSSTPSP